MKEITDGGYLELVNEFEVAGGGAVYPHTHPTHEFYYVTSGRGIMTIEGDEARSPRATSCIIRPRRRPQPEARERQRLDPLLVLRRRRQGRRPIDYTTHG